MCANTASRVLDHVNSQQHVLTNLMKDLVEAESPSAHPETHDDVRRILRLALASAGYESRETGGMDKPSHVFARPAERTRGRPSQLVVGHFDTVWPVGTVRDRPFRIDGNIIHGPGSFDMKGGLAQKMVLHLLSTSTMVKLGRVEGNLMTHLIPVSRKLRGRAIGLVAQLGCVDASVAERLLDEHRGSVQDAVAAARGGRGD